MTETPLTHRRHNTRLHGYDYSLSGAYFFTIVTQNRYCVFGNVDIREMQLNAAGEMIHRIWQNLPARFPTLILDAFIAMPNHIHGIIVINRPINPSDQSETPPFPNHSEPETCKFSIVPKLGEIIGAFKSQTTVEYTRGVKEHGWTPFQRRLWQRNYYDRIIRNDHELNLIRRYIAENPLKWHLDHENPTNRS